MAARGPSAGSKASEAAFRAPYSTSVSSMSAAATLLSSCATVEAPGIATTFGCRITHASAICAGLASCAAATSRRTLRTGRTASRFSGRNKGFIARTRDVGRCSRV